MKLSEHFTLAELTLSQTAKRLGIQNEPSPDAVENLRFLANRLEEVRALLQAPILVSSGFRSPALNRAVGGSVASQHCLGLAADFIAPAFGDPYDVAEAISKSPIQFDQLIHEFGSWTHISFVRDNPRRQVLSIFTPGRYEPGLVRRGDRR